MRLSYHIEQMPLAPFKALIQRRSPRHRDLQSTLLGILNMLAVQARHPSSV